MLSDAGIDMVVFDVTNNLTYPRSYLALCRVWSQVCAEGAERPRSHSSRRSTPRRA